MKIIIPASGIGKRFIEAGYTDTKPLIDVTPELKIIDYVINSFDRKEDEFIIIASKHTYNEVSDYINKLDIKSTMINCGESKEGPVGTIVSVEKELNSIINAHTDQIMISYCDYGMEWNYKEFKEFIKSENPDGVIPCYSGYHPHLTNPDNVYAAVKTLDNKIIKVHEKYKSNDRYNEKWSAGAYYFKSLSLALVAFKRLIEAKDTLNGEYYCSLAYNYILKSDLKTFNVDKFYQFGTPKDFEEAKENIIKYSNIIKSDVKASIENTVVLSAGRGERFFNLGYQQPKPFIPLGKSDFITNITDTLKNVDTKISYIGATDHKIFWDNSGFKNIRLIKPNTIGAAFSYKESSSDLVGDTLIIPCDLLANHITKEFVKETKEAEAIIFVTEASDFALENSSSFSWVTSKGNDVVEVNIKEKTNESQKVLIGSFWIKDNKILLDAIDEIFEKDLKTLGEFYLDDAFKLLLEKGINVKSVELKDYYSLGTPSEYKTNSYYIG